MTQNQMNIVKKFERAGDLTSFRRFGFCLTRDKLTEREMDALAPLIDEGWCISRPRVTRPRAVSLG